MDRLVAIDLLLAAIAFLGHFSIAVWLFNRLHAQPWARQTIKALEKVLLLVAAFVVALFVLRWLVAGYGFLPSLGHQRSVADWLWLGYAALSWLAAALVLPCWLIPKLRERLPQALVSNDTTLVDVRERLGFAPLHGTEARLLARLPGNEIFRLAIQRKTIEYDRLPPELNGLSIAHLSDLHMTGELGREFYDVVVDETNALEPDLIAITGDILETTECLPWIWPTLGRLRAKRGKYFILGNHEMRLTGVEQLRAALSAAGLVDLGGHCERKVINEAEVLFAGNELPWFGKAPDIGTSGNSKFRVLLSHTPDQLIWARANGFDLMLAGHNHGGQIRLPYLGALISPSRYGFRYAGGLYHEPPTLLHVSRGISGIHPIRLNCPPELALLVLQSTRSTINGSGGSG
jgi:uncharacterized protein